MSLAEHHSSVTAADAPNAGGVRFTVPEAALAVRAEALRRGICPGSRGLTGPLARRIRGLLEDGRLPYEKAKGRYRIAASDVGRVADMLGLHNGAF